MECESPTNFTNDACYCPAGYSGYNCGSYSFTRCYVNITEPAFYEGCKGNFSDSFSYDYSIQGHDPCFYFDFE